MITGNSLTPEQMMEVLVYAETNDSSLHLAMMLVCSGLRIGEVLELQWKDVLFQEGVIKVRNSKVAFKVVQIPEIDAAIKRPPTK